MITLSGQHFAEDAIIQSVHYTLDAEYNKHVFQMLNPRIERDGTKWCCIWGQMPELYIAGFGDTPEDAIREFALNYRSSKFTQP